MKLALLIMLLLLTTGCAMQRRVNSWATKRNQEYVNRCAAKYGIEKCHQLQYPSSEQGFDGVECKQ